MIAKEFEAAKASRSLLFSFSILLVILAVGALPQILEFFREGEFRWVNLVGVSAIMVPFLISALSNVRKYSVDRQYLYIHKIIWRKKISMKNLIDVEKRTNLMESDFSWKKLLKKKDFLSYKGQYKDKKVGSYEAYVTDPDHLVLLIFRDKKIAVSPQYTDRFIGFVRSFVESG
ncbi:MAG TPA: PH domain-containing protein [bacterium]|nr:PH domain-containing protein [bacterium]